MTKLPAAEYFSEEHALGERDGADERENRQRVNLDCPQCDREVVSGPWGSLICWWCPDVIYVTGGEYRA